MSRMREGFGCRKRHCSGYDSKVMKPLRALAAAFINTFGITQPSAKGADRAAWFIAILLGMVLCVFFATIGFAIHVLLSH